jgi:hypothetical protein
MLNEKVKLLKMSIRTVVLVRTGGQLIDPMRTAKHAMICHVKDFFKYKKKSFLKIVISQGVVELVEIVTFGGDTF